MKNEFKKNIFYLIITHQDFSVPFHNSYPFIYHMIIQIRFYSQSRYSKETFMNFSGTEDIYLYLETLIPGGNKRAHIIKQ